MFAEPEYSKAELSRVASKEQILEESGYVYSFNREIYFNRKAKKVLSREFVDDHSEDELHKSLNAETDGWHFFFNSQPPEAVQRELKGILG